MYQHKIKPTKSFELQRSSNTEIFKTFVNALTVRLLCGRNRMINENDWHETNYYSISYRKQFRY